VNIFHSTKYLLKLKNGNSSVATDEFSHAIKFGDRNQPQLNSSVATDKLQLAINQVYCEINPIEAVAKSL
jgi:hypothetical protein